MNTNTTHYPQFFTATVLEWKFLLKKDAFKLIIIDSLKFLVSQKRVIIYAYVIMDNHIHIIWHIQNGNTKAEVQHSLLSFTAKQLKKELEKDDNSLTEPYRVNAKDRNFQIWERNALSIDLFTPSVFEQKLNYIHNNPVKAGLCKYPEEYYFSSANFYYNGIDSFNFVTHYAV